MKGPSEVGAISRSATVPPMACAWRAGGWYLRQWASGGDGLTPEVAVYLVEQVIAVVWPGERVGAALELVRALERIYDGHATPRPAWLSVVREAYRSR